MSQTRLHNASTGQRIPFEKVLLALAGSDDPLASRMTDHDGATAWDELQPQPNTPYRLIVQAPGFQPFAQDYPTVYTDIDITLTPITSGLSPLVRIERHRFVTADGRRVFLKMTSDFVLFWRYLEGEDIDPVLAQRQALGFNCVRVFGMCHYVMVNDLHAPTFKPSNHPDYHPKQLAFFQKCARFGQYPYFCEFPDNAYAMENEDDHVPYHEANAENMRQVGGILEATNEYFAHSWNQVDFNRILKPVGVLACSTSQGEGLHQWPWDFGDFHPRRDFPAHVKEQCLSDNPNFEVNFQMGLGENFNADKESNAVDKYFQVGGSALGTALFSSFHCEQGKQSRLFDGQTLEAALAFIEGSGG